MPFKPSLAFVLLCLLLATLWVAGGASRADALGQPLVRGVSWTLLMVAILLGERPASSIARPVAILLAAAWLLAILQLVPLPPAVWQAFAGRETLVEAAAASGQEQPWRPWSMVPGATLNAASSLIVPTATLVFMAGLTERERSWLPSLLLGLVVASTFIGLLQFSGVALNNPFINDVPGQVSGNFANRNHLALWLALGCLLAPTWAFWEGRRPKWRGLAAACLVLLLILVVLAIGSRAGLVACVLAVSLGLLMVRNGIARELRRAPRWVSGVILFSLVAVIVAFVLISIAADRAESLNRVLTDEVGEDLRGRALPIIVKIIQLYFPFGSGIGSFDPIFRMNEPFNFLGLKYLNHAHNDFIEIMLESGLAGLLLLTAAVVWWLRASSRAWRSHADPNSMIAKLGSAMLFLILFASAFDYPARTPMIMAVVIIAAQWLSEARSTERHAALPANAELI